MLYLFKNLVLGISNNDAAVLLSVIYEIKLNGYLHKGNYIQLELQLHANENESKEKRKLFRVGGGFPSGSGPQGCPLWLCELMKNPDGRKVPGGGSKRCPLTPWSSRGEDDPVVCREFVLTLDSVG